MSLILMLIACGENESKVANNEQECVCGTACSDEHTTEANPLTVDDDGDGLSEEDGDCDDNDSTIYPHAPMA